MREINRYELSGFLRWSDFRPDQTLNNVTLLISNWI